MPISLSTTPNTPQQPVGSPWALTLGSIAGVPVRVHSSFLLLLLWVATQHQSTAFTEIVFTVLVFGCVLAHEFGHILCAQRFGVRTQDVMLYPFGGVASIAGEFSPRQEILVALAGPAVNAILVALLFLLPEVSATTLFDGLHPSLLVRLAETNIVLACFNLIPALPMDGGRVLRASLRLLQFSHATVIAGRLSQGACLLLGLAAIWFEQPVLFLIAAFVFMSAMQEIVQERAQIGALGHSVEEAMTPLEALQPLSHGMTLSAALPVALKATHQDLPVFMGAQFLGLVERQLILESAAAESEESYVSGLMTRAAEFTAVEKDTPLRSFTEESPFPTTDPVLITANGEFVGLLYREQLLEFLYVHSSRLQRGQVRSNPATPSDELL